MYLIVDFLQSSPDAAFLVAPDGRVLRANAVAARLFGAADEAELCGIPVETFVPHRVRAAHAGHRASFTASPQVRAMGTGVELVALRLNGTEVPVEISLAPLEAGLVLVVVRDVSERRRLLDALRASEAAARTAGERQSQILDALPANVALVDSTGRIVAVNGAWSAFGRDNGGGERACGVGVDYLASCKRGADAGAEGAAEAYAALSELLDGRGEQRTFEYPCHDRQTQRWFRASMVALVEGGRRHVVVMHTDVTERALAVQALRRSEQSLAVTLRSIGVGVIVTDENDRVVRMNAEAERLTEWTEADAVGRPLEVVAALAPSAGEERQRPTETATRKILTGRAGTIRPVCVRANPLVGSEAERGTVTVIADRENEERAERERQALELRLQLADRLVSMGTLAAGVAHEINNPLAFVLMNLELALETLVAPRAPVSFEALGASALVEWLNDALQGAMQVRDIVSDLRAFSRVDAPRSEPFDVRTAIRFAVSVTANQIRHRARLVEDLDEVPLVAGDAGRLGQVFVTLLVNAAQAIPEGRPASEYEVSVRLHRAGDCVRVEIRDTGAGIDPAHVGRVFEPFFTTKPTGSGTGLGLAIAHAIVREHGGDISIESTVGQGTCVTVTLPVAAGATRARPLSRVPVAMPGGAQKRLLVVDDEPAIGRALKRMLRAHDVVAVTSGADALARIAEQRFDLVLCDLMMPDLDGPELYREVCAKCAGYEERFVFMTGGAFTDRARAFLEGRSADRIAKPFERREIEATLAEAFQRADRVR